MRVSTLFIALSLVPVLGQSFATVAAERAADGRHPPSVLPAAAGAQVDALLKDVELAYASKDVERFVSLFTDDFEQLDVNRRVSLKGKAAWRKQTQDVNAVHREMSRRHFGRIATGDTVIVEIEWAGIVRGDIRGPNELDLPYRYRGLGILKMRDGKLSRQILYSDHATFLEQLVLSK